MWGITFLSLCLATPAVPFGLLWLFQGVVFLYCVVNELHWCSHRFSTDSHFSQFSLETFRRHECFYKPIHIWWQNWRVKNKYHFASIYGYITFQNGVFLFVPVHQDWRRFKVCWLPPTHMDFSAYKVSCVCMHQVYKAQQNPASEEMFVWENIRLINNLSPNKYH